MGDLHGHQANGATPAEADTEAAKQTGIQAVGTSLDLGQDHGIVFRQAGRVGLADSLGLFGRLAIDSGSRNGLEIGILAVAESVLAGPPRARAVEGAVGEGADILVGQTCFRWSRPESS